MMADYVIIKHEFPTKHIQKDSETLRQAGHFYAVIGGIFARLEVK